MYEIDRMLDSVSVGPAATHGGLAMYPLLTTQPDIALDCLTIEEATGEGLCRITEVNEQGSVPDVRFENLGDRSILLVDGDELAGARQNRVVNLSILVGALSMIVIPVSCVERGRWRYASRDFRPSGKKLFSRARAQAMREVLSNARAGRAPRADQLAVWDAVDDKLAAMGAHSVTSAMEAAYEAGSDMLLRYQAALPAQEGQIGAVFAIGEHVVGMELFGSPRLLRKALPRTVGSFALDAMERGHSNGCAPLDAAEALLREARAAPCVRRAGLGEGENLYLQGASLTGTALVAEQRVVHLAAFRHAGTPRPARTNSEEVR